MTANMKLLVMGRVGVWEENKKTDGLDGPVDRDNEGPFQDGNLRGNGGVRGAVAPPPVDCPRICCLTFCEWHVAGRGTTKRTG